MSASEPTTPDLVRHARIGIPRALDGKGQGVRVGWHPVPTLLSRTRIAHALYFGAAGPLPLLAREGAGMRIGCRAISHSREGRYVLRHRGRTIRLCY